MNVKAIHGFLKSPFCSFLDISKVQVRKCPYKDMRMHELPS